MTARTMLTDELRQMSALSEIPNVDLHANLSAAVNAGRRMRSILAEVISLRRGVGRLSPAEYFYYRLWDPTTSMAQKRRYVGKQAQGPMHLACNNTSWYATAADKLLFHTLMEGAGLPHPDLLAITNPLRTNPGAVILRDAPEIVEFFRDPRHYPLFAKPIDGRFSLGAVNADCYDTDTNQVQLRGADPASPEVLANHLLERKAGYLIQRRMAPHPDLSACGGDRLWSVRVIVLLTADGPVIHRAIAKIPTGANPADNFWRPGNMLGAVDLRTGELVRVVRGTGYEMEVNGNHPDTGQPIAGRVIQNWQIVAGMIRCSSQLLPGIRTQSWDVALTEDGPVLLEVNFGGDLNLAQLADGAGVLDDQYLAHLGSCGYRLRRSRSSCDKPNC
jgi:hypothetical protein